jgi:ParB/RepB/Spo0J family partition protein
MAKKFTRRNFEVPSGDQVTLDEQPANGQVDSREDVTEQTSESSPTHSEGENPGFSTIQPVSDRQEALLDDILDNDYQTREGMSQEKFRRLVKSMQEEGPQEPIQVRKHPKVPGKWQIVRGGHSRRDAARAAGLTHYPITVVDYDDKRSALATARENLAREDLTPLEEGRFYLSMKSFGYTQEALADELGISRDRIKECEALAKSAPEIQEMIQRIKNLDGDPNRGLRAAKYLRRLDDLEKKNPGLATRIRGPLIDAFLYERITTDDMDVVTKQLVGADDPEKVLATMLRGLRQKEEAASQEPEDKQRKTSEEPPLPEIQRTTNLNLATRRFRQFVTLIGTFPPSEEERRALAHMRNEIDAILNR